MKNKLLFATSLLALTLLFGVMSNTVQADISNFRWLGYTYSGYDAFHRTSVHAFESNSTAILSVTVYNDYFADEQMNISALKVEFDWGTSYTSSLTSMQKPFTIPWHESRVITIVFTVPTLAEVSNKAQYSYTIYLEHVNSTTAPQEIVETEKEFGGSNFVVYSADQVEAQRHMQIISEIQSMTSPGDFNSTRARLLWMNAENETFVAGMLYSQGDFEGAKNHYTNALSLINQAMEKEEAKGGGFDDAQVQVLEAHAKSLEATANYLNGLSNMWVLIGVAAVLFAIGYIIRGLGALRRPVVAAA